MTRAFLPSVILLAACGNGPDGSFFGTTDDDALAKGEKVSVCHATSSTTNPYVVVTVSESAWVEGTGHGGHADDYLLPTWYADADGDGYGDADDSIEDCLQPSGYVDDGSDCDDTDIDVNPGAEEECDGYDNNCDGEVDEGTGGEPTTCGEGECAAEGEIACEDGVLVDTCTEGEPTTEDCDDSLDNDCDGLTDYDDADDCSTLCDEVVCPQDEDSCTVAECDPATGECVTDDLEDGEVCVDSSLTESFIPNPSFEEFTSCPTSFSQLYLADTWIQATSGTSDFWVSSPSCDDSVFTGGVGGIGPIPQHAPDGDGFVGAIVMPSYPYFEYIGACLDEPLTAGTDYTFQMQVAAAEGGPGYSYGGDSLAGIALLCITDCAELPISGYDDISGDYEVIGSTTADLVGGEAYQTVTIDAMSSTDCPAVIFGPTADSTVQSGMSGAYILFDDLTLNESESFEGVCESGECVPVE